MTPGAQESYEQGLYYLEKWDLDKAEEALREVIELEPNHARAWNKLGVLFARREDLRQAEECFEEALRLDSHFADPYSNLGNIYAERGDGRIGPRPPMKKPWCWIRATPRRLTILVFYIEKWGGRSERALIC